MVRSRPAGFPRPDVDAEGAVLPNEMVVVSGPNVDDIDEVPTG